MKTTYDFQFLRRRAIQRRVAIVTAVFAAGALTYDLVARDWYRSELTVVPADKQDGGGLASLAGAELAGIAAGFDLGGGSADVNRIAAVFESNGVSDAVIAKFGLRERYDVDYQEDARKALWSHCEVKAQTKPGLVDLACEDRDPKVAKAMLEYFAEYGNQVFRQVSVSTASEEVRLLEAHVDDLRRAADESTARVREFEEAYGIVDLETQSKAVVGAMAALNTQKITKQLELEYAHTFASRDEATTRQLESQLSLVDQKLQSLQDSPPAAKGAEKGTLFPAAMKVPRLRADYERLFRERRVSEATLVFALERLEGARASAARAVATFQVLDPPALSDKRARPKRIKIFLGVTLAGLVLAGMFEFWHANRAALAGSDEDDVEEIEAQSA